MLHNPIFHTVGQSHPGCFVCTEVPCLSPIPILISIILGIVVISKIRFFTQSMLSML